MSALVLATQRTAQPQGAAPIDLGNPLSRGLAFSLSGVDGRDLVRGGAITRTASISTGVTRYGFGFSSSANSAFSRAIDLSGTSEITVSFVLVLRASTTAVLVEHTANYGANAGSFLIYTDGGNFLAGVSNGAGGATGFNLSQCPAPALNVPVRVVVTLRRLGTTAKACRIWFDGVEQSTTQPNSGAIGGNFANSTTYFLGRGAASIFANAIIQDPAIFGRALSDGEAASLSRNQWQLFKPVERRIWVPASTGGSVGNASGSLSSITTSAASAGASGAAQSAAACASLSVTPAEASASGGVSVVGNASASLASLSLSAASASASGSAAASAALVGISIAPASAVASGGASVPATASASLASLSTAPATATASGAATAAGAMLGMNLTPAQAQATAAAWAAAELRALSIAPATATAGDGSAAPWPTGRADPQHLAVVPFAGVRAMVPAADLRAAVPFTGVSAIVQQDTP